MDFLGPVAGVPMAIMALLVWWRRGALRKGHVWLLIAMTAIGLVGFFVVLVAGMGHRIPDRLVMPLLHVTAWLTAGGAAGFTVAFWVLWFRRSEER